MSQDHPWTVTLAKSWGVPGGLLAHRSGNKASGQQAQSIHQGQGQRGWLDRQVTSSRTRAHTTRTSTHAAHSGRVVLPPPFPRPRNGRGCRGKVRRALERGKRGRFRQIWWCAGGMACSAIRKQADGDIPDRQTARYLCLPPSRGGLWWVAAGLGEGNWQVPGRPALVPAHPPSLLCFLGHRKNPPACRWPGVAIGWPSNNRAAANDFANFHCCAAKN